MKKNEFNSRLREYVKKHLSPNEVDKKFVSGIYDFFKQVLESNCFQIGSFPRFTAIRPLHDLDIIYILGKWKNEDHASPLQALKMLEEKIRNHIKYQLQVCLQDHSVTIIFKNKDDQVFSVDIIPAYETYKNEFGHYMYKVPEIFTKKHGKERVNFYQQLSQQKIRMKWIDTDPIGYIEIAKRINQQHNDFRKTVKFIKKWKELCKKEFEDFNLKSFHLEQVIASYFQNNKTLEIFDAIFEFFYNIPEIIKAPQIQDRADKNKYIDEYLNDIKGKQKKIIIQARDGFLVKLENFTTTCSIKNLINPCFFQRSSTKERFLFDHKIPILTENTAFRIDGRIKEKAGYRDGWLSEVNNKIAKNREINFEIRKNIPNDYTMWKVQNDKESSYVPSDSTRGEITENRTSQTPEHTRYNGNHYVECFAITNGTCIARAKVNVKIS